MRLKWLSRINLFKTIFIFVAVIATYSIVHECLNLTNIEDLNVTRRYIESKLQKALREDKGTGCKIPRLDPFSQVMMHYDKMLPRVHCKGENWVKCYLHECRVVNNILAVTTDVICTYQDIIHLSDTNYTLGAKKTVFGDAPYLLISSDHVKVGCTGKKSGSSVKWQGYGIGFRQSTTKPRPLVRPINVLIFAFDSASKAGFIRKMPKSYSYITTVINATILNGYNVVGDGTSFTLFPLLTGKTELELPDVRNTTNKRTLDSFPFIFFTMNKLGYHTEYFEDMTAIGTFQYRFNGFKRQPADHYLRSYFTETDNKDNWYPDKPKPYCVGDVPRYELMMNITEQFMQLPGNKFGFTFISDISHEDLNLISTADDALVRFLDALKIQRVLDNTLLFIMGDHGPRYSAVRHTLQGKLEERLPLMAIHLPPALTETRPDIVKSLSLNTEVLTTPNDIHATILDALDLKHMMNPYKIKGADLNRALSLFQPIPRTRSCSEAGIEPHWCACAAWHDVSSRDALYRRAATGFLSYVNSLTDSLRDKCELRTLSSISWVKVQRVNNKLLSFKAARDHGYHVGRFSSRTVPSWLNYQLKVTLGPGNGVYEATATYFTKEDLFVFDTRDISRISAYNSEPNCLSKMQRHLNKYCYCKDYLPH